MITKEFEFYIQFFEDVIEINPVQIEKSKVSLKVDLSLIQKFINHIKKFSLIESTFLVPESLFYSEFKKYYLKQMNVKKDVEYDSTYKSYLQILNYNVKKFELITSVEKKKFIYSLSSKPVLDK